MTDPSMDKEFIEQFELLLRQVEQIIMQYPPELHDALRDEARVALRLQLQARWEAQARALEQRKDI